MVKKLRHSRQRDMIYEYLLTTKEHPSADKIYEDLRHHISNLSLGTVYRNLKVLEEMGLVRRVTTLQNVERYDACCHDHAHFVCDHCGCVKNLDHLNVEMIAKFANLGEGDKILRMNVTFGGLCTECAALMDDEAAV